MVLVMRTVLAGIPLVFVQDLIAEGVMGLTQLPGEGLGSILRLRYDSRSRNKRSISPRSSSEMRRWSNCMTNCRPAGFAAMILLAVMMEHTIHASLCLAISVMFQLCWYAYIII
jgi:hypothetical protein